MCSGMLPLLAWAGIPVWSSCSTSRWTSGLDRHPGEPASTSGDADERPGGGGGTELPAVPSNWAITVGIGQNRIDPEANL